MARRKAEQWASEAERVEAMPDRWVEAPVEPLRGPMSVTDDERLHAIEITLNAVSLVTPEAGVRILHQAMADLVSLIREVNSR